MSRQHPKDKPLRGQFFPWQGLASWLLAQASRGRLWAYRKQWLQTVRLKTPVISLGNLTVGGTGKTPLVDLIVTAFENKGKKVGIVSRAYKAEAVSPQQVDVKDPRAARIFGDEPLWLALKHPMAVVYVGSKKWRTARVLETLENVDVIVVDDGFQHLRLFRKLNLLLIDLSQPISQFELVPRGRAREPFSGIDRADFILFTKSQSKNLETEKWLRGKGVFAKPYAILRQELEPLRRIHSLPDEPARPFAKKSRHLVVCALADPNSFLRLLQKRFPECDFETLFYADHYPFTERDIKNIERTRILKHCEFIVVTEKDEVKLKTFNQCATWIVAPLRVQFEEGEKDFYECLDQVIG